MAGGDDGSWDKRCPNVPSAKPEVSMFRLIGAARSLICKTSVPGAVRPILPVPVVFSCCVTDAGVINLGVSRSPVIGVAASAANFSAVVCIFVGAGLACLDSGSIRFIVGSAPARCITTLYFRAVALSQSLLINWFLPLNNLSRVCWSRLNTLASFSWTLSRSCPSINRPAK